MICQQEAPARIFGKAAPVLAGPDGRWTLEFPPFPAGGPYELAVRSRNAERRIRDILFADLWFCSGQLDMEFPLARTWRAEAPIWTACLPQTRHFTVASQASDLPSDTLTGGREICGANTAGGLP